jgi:hypothetical protein
VRFIKLRASNFLRSDANAKEYYGIEITGFQFIPLCLLLRSLALAWNVVPVWNARTGLERSRRRRNVR